MKQTDYTPHLLAGLFLFACAVNMPACYRTPGAMQAQAARKYYFDLPEEIQNSTGKDLQVYDRKGDTFFLSFKPEVYNQCYQK